MDKNCLEQAINNLVVQSVYLRKSKIDVHFGFNVIDRNDDEEKKVTQSFRAISGIKQFEIKNDEDTTAHEYRFLFTVAIRLIKHEDLDISNEDDFEPLIEIFGEFEAKYHSEIELEYNVLSAFAENNVGYHVWPYWREYVQSSCFRIGLSNPFHVPLYRVNHSDNEEMVKAIKDITGTEKQKTKKTATKKKTSKKKVSKKQC